MEEEFDMPTPCKNCGEWFDLHEGGPSKDGKFQLCIDCSNEEQATEDQECYKSGERCKYDCSGLCRESY